MPSIKLSELPVFTGDSSGSHIVINDPGNTTTYTTQKEYFFTSSLYGTASWALTASYSMNGGGAGFPYTGDAVITGSLTISPTSSITTQLLPNPTFDGSTTGWVLGSDVVYYENNVSCSYVGGQPYVYTDYFPVKQGAQYNITFTLSNVQNDTLYAYAWNNNIGLDQIGDGTWELSFTSSFTGDEYLFFDLWNYNLGATYTLDDAYVVETSVPPSAFISGSVVINGSLDVSGSFTLNNQYVPNIVSSTGTQGYFPVFGPNGTTIENSDIYLLGATIFNLNPVAGQFAWQFNGSTVVGSSYGVNVFAGTNNSDIAFRIQNPSTYQDSFKVKGDGNVILSNLLTLATQDPLPTSNVPTGSIMVSGSDANNKPYYWNGATWTALF